MEEVSFEILGALNIFLHSKISNFLHTTEFVFSMYSCRQNNFLLLALYLVRSDTINDIRNKWRQTNNG
jgi:hypothetical protein